MVINPCLKPNKVKRQNKMALLASFVSHELYCTLKLFLNTLSFDAFKTSFQCMLLMTLCIMHENGCSPHTLGIIFNLNWLVTCYPARAKTNLVYIRLISCAKQVPSIRNSTQRSKKMRY